MFLWNENVSMNNVGSFQDKLVESKYCTGTIISRGLYISYPISKDDFFVFKEVFSENSVLMYKPYIRLIQEQLVIKRGL